MDSLDLGPVPGDWIRVSSEFVKAVDLMIKYEKDRRLMHLSDEWCPSPLNVSVCSTQVADK